MERIIALISDFSIYSVIVRLTAAVLLGGLIGLERGRHGRAAGLRTHILVCIGSALTSLTSMYLENVLGNTGDLARLSAQVISGIGFLGAGTILIRTSTSVITGLTTAAGLWATAAIGISLGFGFYSGAFFATLICLFAIIFLNRFERKSKNSIYIYIELEKISDTENVINTLRHINTDLISYDVIPAKSGHASNVGIMCILKNDGNFEEIKAEISSNNSVVMMLSDISL